MSDKTKLTKAQAEFFQGFVDNMVEGIVRAVLEMGQRTMTDEQIRKVVEAVDTKELRDAAGAEFLKRCSFAELKRVDKLTKSPEFIKVVQASAEVGQAVQAELLAVLGPLIPENFSEPAAE